MTTSRLTSSESTKFNVTDEDLLNTASYKTKQLIFYSFTHWKHTLKIVGLNIILFKRGNYMAEIQR